MASSEIVSASFSLLDIGENVMLKVERVTPELTQKSTDSGRSRNRKLVSDEGALELELNINEMQELRTMSMRPLVRNILASIIMHLEIILNKTNCQQESNVKEGRKWSDVVAGRNLQVPDSNLTATGKIETVITPRSLYYCKDNYEMESSKSTNISTTRKNSIKCQDKRPQIVILGDSHARGLTKELTHQVKQRIKAAGHVKPNAHLQELLITAKEDISKLTKKDSVIVLGGSNDFERNRYGKNLTLIVKFLEATQHTNVFLIDVPPRYDLNTIPNIIYRIVFQ